MRGVCGDCVAVERELLDLRLRQSQIEAGRAGDPFVQGRGGIFSPATPAMRPTSRDHLAQFGRVEHRHQRIAALLEQLGGA